MRQLTIYVACFLSLLTGAALALHYRGPKGATAPEVGTTAIYDPREPGKLAGRMRIAVASEGRDSDGDRTVTARLSGLVTVRGVYEPRLGLTTACDGMYAPCFHVSLADQGLIPRPLHDPRDTDFFCFLNPIAARRALGDTRREATIQISQIVTDGLSWPRNFDWALLHQVVEVGRSLDN